MKVQGDVLDLQFVCFVLQATVPIWKKEMYEDGSAGKENKECEWSNAGKQQAAANPSPDPPSVDPALVQIHASNEEIDRRIEAFIQRKR